MDRSLRRRARLQPALCLTALALCSAVLFLLLFLQIYSSDDYLYLSFLDRGLTGFLADMKWHYAHMNGRLLIHSFACAALHFGHPAVGLLGLAVLWAACLFGLRLCRTGKLPLAGAAVFFAGLLLLPDKVLQHGVLWTAAFYNYVFPVPLLLAALLLLRRQREAEHCEVTWMVPSSISEERYLTQTALEALLGLRFTRTAARIAIEAE